MTKLNFEIEPELLWSLYWGNGYPLSHIANIFCYDSSALRRRMIRYGIPRRSTRELTDFEFNNEQISIFEGCMLGDGGLFWSGNNCYFRNYDIHKDYLVWLQKQLDISSISQVVSADMGYLLHTRAIPSLRSEYNRWYPNGKGTNEKRHRKIVPKDVKLDLSSVLFWYIGDGTYHQECKSAKFTNVLCFDEARMFCSKLCRLLDINVGITCVVHRSGYNIRLGVLATKIFFTKVLSLGFDIPECYSYKFGG